MNWNAAHIGVEVDYVENIGIALYRRPERRIHQHTAVHIWLRSNCLWREESRNGTGRHDDTWSKLVREIIVSELHHLDSLPVGRSYTEQLRGTTDRFEVDNFSNHLIERFARNKVVDSESV